MAKPCMLTQRVFSYNHHHGNTKHMSRAIVPLLGPPLAYASGLSCANPHYKPGESGLFGHLAPFVQGTALKQCSPERWTILKSLKYFSAEITCQWFGVLVTEVVTSLRKKKNDGEDKLFLWMSTISQFSFWLFFCQAVQKNVRGKQIGRKQQQCTNTVFKYHSAVKSSILRNVFPHTFRQVSVNFSWVQGEYRRHWTDEKHC